MIEQIYPVLILIGGTIGVVLLYLWRQAQRANNSSLALIRLNEQLHFDTPAFLRNAWPLLSDAGLRGISWRLDWFGVALEEEAGTRIGKNIARHIQVADMKLAVTFFQSRFGERRYFDEILIETFLLLLRTDMWIKAGATDATFSQMAKLTMFLQHDMKNVAQFIQLMADQVTDIPPGKEQQVLKLLCTAAPLVRQRADRIVSTLTMGMPNSAPSHRVELREMLEQLCQSYQLAYRITGSAAVRTSENTLDSILNNIIKNYSDLALRDPMIHLTLCIAIIDHASQVEITVEAANTPSPPLERLFEPFWSSNPSGLGIGLYQAKQMLEINGGSLQAHCTPTGNLQFQLIYPKNSDTSTQLFHM